MCSHNTYDRCVARSSNSRQIRGPTPRRQQQKQRSRPHRNPTPLLSRTPPALTAATRRTATATATTTTTTTPPTRRHLPRPATPVSRTTTTTAEVSKTTEGSTTAGPGHLTRLQLMSSLLPLSHSRPPSKATASTTATRTPSLRRRFAGVALRVEHTGSVAPCERCVRKDCAAHEQRCFV